MKSSWELVQEEEDRETKEMIKRGIMAMVPGEILDFLVAEKIMEYKWIDYKWWDGTTKKLLWKGNEIPTGDDFGRLYDDKDLLYPWDMPNYSNDIAAAWEVVDEVLANGSFYLWWDDTLCDWNVNWDNKKRLIDDCRLHVRADTAPEAICKATLLAVMEVEK